MLKIAHDVMHFVLQVSWESPGMSWDGPKLPWGDGTEKKCHVDKSGNSFSELRAFKCYLRICQELAE